MVGRSLPFWEHFYPKFKKRFSSNIGDVSLKNFHKAINKVQPSFIRVEADEATYNLHIMLRLEIEIGLVQGEMDVKDLPEIWNSKMKSYLGITPPNDAKRSFTRCSLVWWINRLFLHICLGKFDIGTNLEIINRDIPDLNEEIRKGNESPSWLRSHLHLHGRKYEPQVIVNKICGMKITPEPYLRYLTTKFGELYGL
jgi:carboxypeptidase Taq